MGHSITRGLGDLFKGCRDQNENQLAPGLCPFIMQRELASLLVSLCLLLNAKRHSQAGSGWIWG